jgi:hypothetical protein
VAQNPISYLISCHRVIRSTGAFGGSGGGTARKKTLHAREAAKPSVSISVPRNRPMSAVSDSIADARVNPPALRPRESAPAQHTETTTPIRRLRLRSVES